MVFIPPLLLVLSACGVAGGLEGNPPLRSGSSGTSLQVEPSTINSGQEALAGGNHQSSGKGGGQSPSSGGQQQWDLTWEDDFTGSSLAGKWDYMVSGSGFGNHALEWFSDTNATTGPAGLVIEANKGGSDKTCWYGPCEYTSAEIVTSFAQEYGRFEARIKLPSGKGLWPAFWMRPQLSKTDLKLPGEIDIIEVNNTDPNEAWGYVHDGSVFSYKAKKWFSTAPSSQFHVYGVDWTPSGITWTFDGKPYGHISSYKNWPFDQPYYMLLDLAVGGNWPGPPDASTVFPAKMQVSWVRVYKMANLSCGCGSGCL